MTTKTDTELLNWLETQAKKSRTGVSLDWVPACYGDPSGFRFMRMHFIGDPKKSLRGAIELAMTQEQSFV